MPKCILEEECIEELFINSSFFFIIINKTYIINSTLPIKIKISALLLFFIKRKSVITEIFI